MPKIFIAVLFFLICNTLRAQNPMVTVGSTSGLAGATTTISNTLNSGAIGISTLQFDLVPSTGISAINPVNITTGAASTTAGKTASANVLPSGNIRVLIFGANQTIIGSGVIATVQLNISSNAVSGSHSVGIVGIVSSDPNGGNVPTAGVGGSINVLTKPPAPTNLKVLP